MGKSRMQIMGSILKGLLCAVALTLLLMVGVAALALGLRIPDGTLTALNQVMKLYIQWITEHMNIVIKYFIQLEIQV